jgi:hypothetical protein
MIHRIARTTSVTATMASTQKNAVRLLLGVDIRTQRLDEMQPTTPQTSMNFTLRLVPAARQQFGNPLVADARLEDQ